MRARARERSGQRCPYCKDTVERRGDAVACAGCATLHHRDCFEELGACAIFGCAQESTSEVAVAGHFVRAFHGSGALSAAYQRTRVFSLTLFVLCVAAAGLVLAVAPGIQTLLLMTVVSFVVVPALFALTW